MNEAVKAERMKAVCDLLECWSAFELLPSSGKGPDATAQGNLARTGLVVFLLRAEEFEFVST